MDDEEGIIEVLTHVGMGSSVLCFLNFIGLLKNPVRTEMWIQLCFVIYISVYNHYDYYYLYYYYSFIRKKGYLMNILCLFFLEGNKGSPPQRFQST